MQSVKVQDGAENESYTTEEVVEDFSPGTNTYYRQLTLISPSIGVAQLLSPEPDIRSLPLIKWKHMFLYPALKNSKSQYTGEVGKVSNSGFAVKCQLLLSCS